MDKTIRLHWLNKGLIFITICFWVFELLLVSGLSYSANHAKKHGGWIWLNFFKGDSNISLFTNSWLSGSASIFSSLTVSLSIVFHLCYLITDILYFRALCTH